MSWANLYPRVVQTAQNFVRGFLGNTAAALGSVITINSTASVDVLFDSLAPSDQCPLYKDGNGGTPATTWTSIYLPSITARLQGLITGNLTLAPSDVGIFPYLCGFESQITGSLSPWCGVFTDAELVGYEYAQDLRYYYGSGPGTDLPSKIFLPFANALVGLLVKGPGTKGVAANGSSYVVPSIITAFTNDGQMTQLNSALGVWDGTVGLGNGTAVPEGYTYRSSHFVTMRGTVAFERLRCEGAVVSRKRAVSHKRNSTTTHAPCPTSTSTLPSSSNSTTDHTYVRILLNDAVYPLPVCKNGPGKSCLLSEYKSFLEKRLAGAGDLKGRCNVTAVGAPVVLGGASFFTDLRGVAVGSVAP